jgi:hypothetical protein
LRLVAALVIVIALGACSGSNSDSAPTTSTLNPFASNVPASAASSGSLSASGASASLGPPLAPPPQLAVGDCFNADSIDAAGAIDSNAVHLVPCTDPHQHEAYAIEQHPDGPDAPYPGDAAVDAFASDRCLRAFADYVGADYVGSSLDTAIVRPDAGRWAFGDRNVVCTVHDADFAPLTGSVRGTGK